MYEMIMNSALDANACLTPRGVTVLHSPVTTFVAGTQSHFRVFSGLAKCTLQETLGLGHPFIAGITLTCPACVHPPMVLHPLAYITSPKVTINCIYAVSLLSNR
jgi:hypothetical protein